MAQPITDYAEFFAGAKQAVKELEQLKLKEAQLEEEEKELERNLRDMQKAVAETVASTMKRRTEEISESYDGEIIRVQDQLKKVRAKREKAKNQGEKERIEEETAPLYKEIKDLNSQMKTLFHSNRVPSFCRNGYYYALYFTKGLKEAGMLLLTLLVCFLAIPCGVYFLIPERRSFYLIIIYLAAIVIFGGLYVTVGNRTKLRYMDVLKKGRAIRSQIQGDYKEVRSIERSIRRDKNEAVYNLEKFDDEIAQLNQDMDLITRKKREALNTFDTVTKSIIADEIIGNHKAELDQTQSALEETTGYLRSLRNLIKETALTITDQYEVYVGKDFMTPERLNALDDILKNKAASNISEAIVVYKGGAYEDGNYRSAGVMSAKAVEMTEDGIDSVEKTEE